MPIETIRYRDKEYPTLQSKGNATQFALPYARHFCTGVGYDIGCNRLEWALPGSIPIDITFNNGYDAYNLPSQLVDYIYSSHCLEHLDDWIEALKYWSKHIRTGGVIFLYLPHYDQEYWRPWNNKKHKHIMIPNIVDDYLKHLGFKNIFCSGKDLNDSFMIVGEKDV